MTVLTCSHPDPQGHVVFVERDETVRVSVAFVDGSAPVELTDQMPDLVLHGLRLQARQAHGVDGAPLAGSQVTVGEVVLDGPEPDVLYGHMPAGQALRMQWPAVRRLLELAVADLVTAGVAADVADVPDDAAALDELEPGTEA